MARAMRTAGRGGPPDPRAAFRSAPPFVLVAGATAAALERVGAAATALRVGGWTVVDGWAAPLGRDRVVCTGRISTRDGARRALLAAVAGAGLVVAVSTDLGTLDQLVDDLRRLGPVDLVASIPAGIGRLTPAQRGLLLLLGDGATVIDAAASLGITDDAAERRLAGARRVLGLATTAAAIAAARGPQP